MIGISSNSCCWRLLPLNGPDGRRNIAVHSIFAACLAFEIHLFLDTVGLIPPPLANAISSLPSLSQPHFPHPPAGSSDPSILTPKTHSGWYSRPLVILVQPNRARYPQTGVRALCLSSVRFVTITSRRGRRWTLKEW